jgi:hypothetical protein
MHKLLWFSRLSHSVECLILSSPLVKIPSSRYNHAGMEVQPRRAIYVCSYPWLERGNNEEATRRNRKTWSSDSDLGSGSRDKKHVTLSQEWDSYDLCYKNAQCFRLPKHFQWEDIGESLSLDWGKICKTLWLSIAYIKIELRGWDRDLLVGLICSSRSRAFPHCSVGKCHIRTGS